MTPGCPPPGQCSSIEDPADWLPDGCGFQAARGHQPHPDHVKSQRPLRGAVSPDEQHKFMEMFSQGRFSSAGLHFLEKHRLGGKQSLLLRGSKCKLPSITLTSTLLLPSFQHCPESPGEAREDQAPRMEGVPGRGDTWRSCGSCLPLSECPWPLALWTPHSHETGPNALKEAETFLKGGVLLA